MTNTIRTLLGLAAAAAVAGLPAIAGAADRVRVIDSTKGPFDHFAVHQALDQGFFKKKGLDVSIIFGSGGAATLQALLTGSQDIAVGVGVLSVIGAYAKGAPVRIIGNTFKGVSNVVWYVPVKSPIKTFKDLEGKQFAYSRAGSTTHLATQYILKEKGIHAKLVSTGGMASSRTQVMSGQVDTGWLAAPTNLELMRTGQARIIGTGKEAGALNDMTVRVVAANSNWLAKHRDAAKRFMQALAEGREFNYSAKGVAAYAKYWKMDVQDAKRAPEFAPREVTRLTPIFGLDKLVKLAHELKYIKKPLPMKKANAMVDIVAKVGAD